MRHMRTMVRSVPCFSQRRPEVTARSRRQRGGDARLRRVDSATSSISAISGKPPARSNAARRANIAWSPVAMPVRRERMFMRKATTARSGSAPAMVTSKRPHSRRVRSNPPAMDASAPYGRSVSACRNKRTSPRPAAATAFICAARPRGAASTRSAQGAASARVASRLPPSTTITSTPRARNGCSAANAASMPGASSSTGMTTERGGWDSITPRIMDSRLALRVVERPVVVEEGDVRLLIAHGGAVLGLVGELAGIAGQGRLHGGEALVAALEILAVPVEDPRHLELLRLRVVAVARAVREEAFHGVVQLGVEPVGGGRLVPQLGAADRGGHAGDGHARIVVDAFLAQHLVLDEIEVGILAEELEELLAPGLGEEAAQVADRFEVRILREDELDREGVVRIDEEGLLLRLGPTIELGPGDLRIIVEHRLQLRVVLGEARVVHARGVAVLHVLHVLLQQVVPRLVGMVEREGARAQQECGKGNEDCLHVLNRLRGFRRLRSTDACRRGKRAWRRPFPGRPRRASTC